jgi:hypothetical protein
MRDSEPPSEQHDASVDSSFAMICLRYVLPAVVILAGTIVMIPGGESQLEGGAGIVGAGLAIFAMNWLVRKASDDRDREQEQAAREFFDLHGRWPDEVAGHAGPVGAEPASRRAAAKPVATTERRLERRAIRRMRGPHGH